MHISATSAREEEPFDGSSLCLLSLSSLFPSSGNATGYQFLSKGEVRDNIKRDSRSYRFRNMILLVMKNDILTIM